MTSPGGFADGQGRWAASRRRVLAATRTWGICALVRAWPRRAPKADSKANRRNCRSQHGNRRYHDPDDDASLADLAEEYSVGRSTIHRIISSSATPPRT
ncbi:hypothetical protein OH799_05060 [Nocardia sp. NBC_00881]|uniref:hypothetical protein n=1 Tax=Nocardia sp. NBC_00881 TaxID=2975995 RepID=UPI00386E6B67|nr:hypothetical protein OH799_05060 [Nocardia sp. NBC_00881]